MSDKDLDKIIKIHIGCVMKNFRLNNRFTVEEVSKEVGTTVEIIRWIENGDFSVDNKEHVNILKDVCKLYKIDFKRLIEHE